MFTRRLSKAEGQAGGRMMRDWCLGLTRLYLVLWVFWALFILVVGPAYVSLQASHQVRAAAIDYRTHVTAGHAIEATEALRRLRENQRTTLASIYQDMFHAWPDFLIPLIAFPLALYGALFGTALLLACVIHGVRPTRRRSPGPAPTRTQPRRLVSSGVGSAPRTPR